MMSLLLRMSLDLRSAAWQKCFGFNFSFSSGTFFLLRKNSTSHNTMLARTCKNIFCVFCFSLFRSKKNLVYLSELATTLPTARFCLNFILKGTDRMLLFEALLTEAAKLVNFELQFKSLKILADILRGKITFVGVARPMHFPSMS